MRVASLSSPVDPDVLVRMVGIIGSKYPEFQLVVSDGLIAFEAQDVGVGPATTEAVTPRPAEPKAVGPSTVVAQASPPWPESPAPTAIAYPSEPIDLIKETSCSWNCGRTFSRRLNLERHEQVCELRESEETS